MPHLVVIAGPIGSGKSTIADLLGRRLAEAGATVSVVDLDDIASTQHGTFAVYEFWRRASVAAATLVRAWFDLGTDVVVAHGPFFESGGYATLLAAQTDRIDVCHVLLRVSFEIALDRVSGDPKRGVSRNPEFLSSTHTLFREIEECLPHPRFEFDTAARSAEGVAEELAAALLAR